MDCVPEPSLDVPAHGGYGIFLIRESADAVAYEREDGYNKMTLTFRFPPAPSSVPDVMDAVLA